MTNPDTPLDLDAVRRRLLNATDAPWAIWPDLKPNGLITIGDATGVIPEGEMWTDGPSNTVAHVYTEEDAEFILHAPQDVADLLSALTATRAERDHYLRSFKAQQAENDRVHAKVREQYDVIEHAKKQRDEARREVHLLTNTEDGRLFVAEQKLAEAREQAKQAQAELADVTRDRDAARAEADGLRVELRDALIAQQIVTATLGATSTAAPQADGHTVWDHYGPCGYCGVTTGPCLNPDDTAPWPIERRVPAPKPHPRRQLADSAAPKADEPQPRTYRDMPVIRCVPGERDIAHMAHVYEVSGEKVVCPGVRPHSVPLPAATPDPATVLRSGPCATANCAFCTRDDCGCSCHDVTHAAPAPADTLLTALHSGMLSPTVQDHVSKVIQGDTTVPPRLTRRLTDAAAAQLANRRAAHVRGNDAEPDPAGGETTTPATRCCPNHREPGEARYGCATAPGVTDPCCNECHYWVAWTRYLDGHDDEDAQPVPAGGEDGSGTADGGVAA